MKTYPLLTLVNPIAFPHLLTFFLPHSSCLFPFLPPVSLPFPITFLSLFPIFTIPQTSPNYLPPIAPPPPLYVLPIPCLCFLPTYPYINTPLAFLICPIKNPHPISMATPPCQLSALIMRPMSGLVSPLGYVFITESKEKVKPHTGHAVHFT